MDAGRELDALIDLHVMHMKAEPDVPLYSTSIADAWQVVEKLGIVVFPMDYHADFTTEHIHGYGAFQGGADLALRKVALCVELYTEDAVWAPTASLAICLAALKSIGAEPTP